jgi:hypothetical protein
LADLIAMAREQHVGRACRRCHIPASGFSQPLLVSFLPIRKVNFNFITTKSFIDLILQFNTKNREVSSSR